MTLGAIDHLVLELPDLEAGAASFRRLGFRTTPRGLHLGHGTAEHCLMFAGAHLKLVGSVDPREPSDVEVRRPAGEARCAIAFAAADMEMAAEDLARRGIVPGDRRDVAFQLELPDETILARYCRLALPDGATPGLVSTLCTPETPAILYQAPWLVHENGAERLARIIVAVAETGSLTEPYERTFGLGRVNRTDEVMTVHAGGLSLVFAGPDDLEALYPELDLAAGPLPRVALLTFQVRDRRVTADRLAAAQTGFIDAVGGPIVEPEEACGLALEFV